jgi:hypothetical protein
VSDVTCYACNSEPVALVEKNTTRGPLPMCEGHLRKANKVGLVDDSEMPEECKHE